MQSRKATDPPRTISNKSFSLSLPHPSRIGFQIEPVDGASVMNHRLKAETTSVAMSLSAFGGVLNFFSGNLRRKTLLFVVVPLIFLSYFGTLAFAIFRFPEAYDWRRSVISHLISPRNNPEFHAIPSFGMAFTGLLMIPFAGYINRRLRVASQLGANIGAFAFGSGVLWLILAGLIVSQRHPGTLSLPRLHEMCARTAALSIGTGLLAFCACALKGYLISATGKKPYQRRLLISWMLLTAVPILGVVLSECLLLTLRAQLPVSPVWKNAFFWHLAFWEWIGSAAVFLFLLSSALFLPEQTIGQDQTTV
jgi:hypothetical protein